MQHELAILGAGNMAEAIARSLLNAGIFQASQVIATDVSAQRRELFQKQLGIRAIENNADAVRDVGIILLSVKPQHLKDVLGSIATASRRDVLVISIAAGISSGFIEQNLGSGNAWRIIRSMPNTPMLIGEGMVAIAAGRHAREEDLVAARRIFAAGATVIELTEDKIDAVTALSGSGPAYFFYLVEQMVQAGVNLGLAPHEAHVLATRTALGAGRMLTASQESPQELRRKVTSPGGTTQAAIETMEAKGVGPAIVAAVQRAAARSRELGA
jgi:pyrroline-5-carboxylate reductase